jgi:PTS system mannose-specific IIB component
VIALVRVDNRLLHGQILEAWVPRMGIQAIVVADDEAAASPLARAAMTLCVPPELPAGIEALGSVRPEALAARKERTLVLVRDVAGVERAVEQGLTPALCGTVNLGNVHFGPDRRPVTPSVFLTEREIAALRRLHAAGFAIEARAVPSESPTGIEEIERRYAEGR